MPELTGAEFKIASYLYHQLEKQAVVDTTIAALSLATGVSWRQTQTCLRTLAKQGPCNRVITRDQKSQRIKSLRRFLVLESIPPFRGT